MPASQSKDLPQKILTINFGGIGDEILFLPTLKEVKRLLPSCRISLILEPRSKSVKEVTNLVDEVLLFDIKKRPLKPGDYLELLNLTRSGKYDLVISSGSSPMVAMLLFASGIPVRIGYGTSALSRLLLTHPVPLNKEQYAGNMYHDLSGGLEKYLAQGFASIPQSSQAPGIQIPEVYVQESSRERMRTALGEEEEKLEERLKSLEDSFALAAADTTSGAAERHNRSNKKRILLHPGTSRLAVQKGIIKTWDSKHWLELIRKLLKLDNTEVILAGGPDDEEVMKDLQSELGEEAKRIINFYGKTKSLADLAALIEMSDLFICVDSAPMHVAVGLNKKVVALFGPTEPAKLIPQTKNFCALTDASKQVVRSLLDGLGVRLLPDTVFQSSLDLLKQE
ncbi:MAG: glycosyltransferase family 9 protein [Candidatus Obscuribacterales bacterium]|nr:glycosyltransferase family 9 protein [Candidatus Obscuribacterales bacterium]